MKKPIEWINTDYEKYNYGNTVTGTVSIIRKLIKYEIRNYNINRWDAKHGDEIIDMKHPHYEDLFINYVLPHIFKSLSTVEKIDVVESIQNNLDEIREYNEKKPR